MGDGHQLVINGELLDVTQKMQQRVGVVGISFNRGCAIMKLPQVCNFYNDSPCAGWRQTNRFQGRWQFNENQNYMYTNSPVLAGLSSSVIAIPENGACLSFQYLITGYDSILHVIHNTDVDINTMKGKAIKTFLQNQVRLMVIKLLRYPSITLNGNQDIEMAFIGMATDGMTRVKSPIITEGKCD